MDKLLTYTGYQILKTPENHALVKKELIVTPFINNEYGEKPNSYPIYKEDDKYLYVPRNWGIENFGVPSKIIFKESEEIDIKFNGELRNYQQEIDKKLEEVFWSDPIEDELNKYGGGIICIPPGGGKTVIAIHHLCKMRVKTLIIVHKTFLMDQWKERLYQYSNASIGIIQQNKCDIENRDVVIAMLQTLLKRDYTELFKQFPLVIIDEVHHIAAESFSQILKNIQVPYLLGLTATPEREDKLEKVFYYYLGNIIHRGKEKKDTTAKINVYYFDSKHEKFKIEINRYTKNINMPKMITNLVEIPQRNEYIVNVIKNILELEPTRKIFILTNRRNHITELEKLIKENLSNFTLGNYIGGMKKEALKISETKQIILGTYEMASEGLDIPDLDTLILATPKSNIIQSIGRIMRKQMADYENPPLVVDIVDRLDVFYAMFQKRRKIYMENKYLINNDKKEEPIVNYELIDECVFDD